VTGRHRDAPFQLRPLRDHDLGRLDAALHDRRAEKLRPLVCQDLALDLSSDHHRTRPNFPLQIAPRTNRHVPLDGDLSLETAMDEDVLVTGEVSHEARVGPDDRVRWPCRRVRGSSGGAIRLCLSKNRQELLRRPVYPAEEPCRSDALFGDLDLTGRADHEYLGL